MRRDEQLCQMPRWNCVTETICTSAQDNCLPEQLLVVCIQFEIRVFVIIMQSVCVAGVPLSNSHLTGRCCVSLLLLAAILHRGIKPEYIKIWCSNTAASASEPTASCWIISLSQDGAAGPSSSGQNAGYSKSSAICQHKSSTARECR